MAEDKNYSRRNLLKLGGASAIALGASNIFAQSFAAMCADTPRQPEGPFYPIADQPDKNSDLTQVDGNGRRALGDIIYISGVVSDQDCAPVVNAVVEIWQACQSGRYNHPGDKDNPSPLDPNFQYWGITTTESDGSYHFKTIIPGHYNAAPNWVRPPHVHYKVHRRGYKELITQMYFKDNRFNSGDRILQSLSEAEQQQVVRPLTERVPENGRQAFDISFDLTIEKIG